VISTLTNIAHNNLNSSIWIAGDFNFNWKDGSITGHSYPHIFAELLLDFVNTDGFTQTVDFPTRKNNILDSSLQTELFHAKLVSVTMKLSMSLFMQ